MGIKIIDEKSKSTKPIYNFINEHRIITKFVYVQKLENILVWFDWVHVLQRFTDKNSWTDIEFISIDNLTLKQKEVEEANQLILDNFVETYEILNPQIKLNVNRKHSIPTDKEILYEFVSDLCMMLGLNTADDFNGIENDKDVVLYKNAIKTKITKLLHGKV